LAHNTTRKLVENEYSLAYLNLILLLHYLVKFKSRSLATYNEFIWDSAGVGSEMIN